MLILPLTVFTFLNQYTGFAGVSIHVTDFNTRTKLFTANFFNKAIGIINFE